MRNRVVDGIHPTAVVDRTARLAEDVEVGPFCVIGADVVLGPGCRLLHSVSIMGNTVCGRDNVFYPFSVIGAPAQDLKSVSDDTRLVIGDRNVFREFVTLHRGTEQHGGVTTIGDDCFLMAYVHIAHDCVVEDGVVMANGVQVGGHCLIERHARFGGLAAMHHFATVGRHAFVGGLTRVVRDVPPFMIVEGNPARVRCVNTVGLRRHGFAAASVSSLREAHRILFRQRQPLSQAMDALKDGIDSDEHVRYLMEFMRRTMSSGSGRARENTRCGTNRES